MISGEARGGENPPPLPILCTLYRVPKKILRRILAATNTIAVSAEPHVSRVQGMFAVEITLIVVGALMILGTLLPFVRSDVWWVRNFDFPRIQILVIAAAVFTAALLLRGTGSFSWNIFLAALALSIAYQLYRIFPYTVLARKQVEHSSAPQPETSLSLLFVNVLMDNRKSARLKNIIRENNPDIILAIETDEWWKGELAEFEKDHPYTVQQPQDNTYGMLLYSRLELSGMRVRFLVEDDIPSMHGRVTLRSGTQVDIHCMHPRPPFPTESEHSTKRDAELLIVGKEIKEKEGPRIVLGDLNDVAWSRTNDLFQRISGLLDPRVGRGFYNTFHAQFFFLRFPLDHFFHSTDFRLIRLKRLPYFGSDHFPVFIALSHEPEKHRTQEKPKADSADRAEANEKISEAKRES